MAISQEMITTAFELPGYRVTKNIGIAKGIVVRSRSIVGSIAGGLQTIVGGNITVFTGLAEKTRNHAYELLAEHASEMGANAIIGMRYDATEMGAGITEVLAYGTAVVVEQA